MKRLSLAVLFVLVACGENMPVENQVSPPPMNSIELKEKTDAEETKEKSEFEDVSLDEEEDGLERDSGTVRLSGQDSECGRQRVQDRSLRLCDKK